MNKPQVSTDRLIVLLSPLAFLALLFAIVSAHPTMVTHSGSANRSTFAVSPPHVTAQLSEKLDTTGNSTLWTVEALAGVLVVLGLSEAVRRHHR